MDITIFDINISTLSKRDIFGYIYFWLYKGDKGYISTINPEFLVLSKKDDDFKRVLQGSKLNTADGIGLIWASWFLSSTKKSNNFFKKIYIFLKWFFSFFFFLLYKKPFLKVVKERIPGSELIYDITKMASELNKKIFLLGGNNISETEIVENKLNKFLENQDNNFSENIIAGKSIGFEKNESMYDENINRRLIDEINNSNAEILFVALGAPKQEKWIYNNIDKLNNIKLAIGIGGTFDFVSGYKKRAPKLFQKLGLEWLFRLFIEPKRWKRIFNAVIKFPMEILKERI